MDQSAVIVIGEKPHRLNAVLALAETLPTVKLYDNCVVDTNHRFELTSTVAPEDLDRHNTPVVIKHDGKYLVIAGRNKFVSGTRSAKVMTTVALKRTRLSA